MFGFAGKLLRVNLSKGETKQELFSEELARKYLGGRGFAARVLYDELRLGIDPLSPENKIVLASGVLTGTPVPDRQQVTLDGYLGRRGVWRVVWRRAEESRFRRGDCRRRIQ